MYKVRAKAFGQTRPASGTRLLRFKRLRRLLPRRRFLQQVILDVLERHVEQQSENYGQKHDADCLLQIDLKRIDTRNGDRSIGLISLNRTIRSKVP